MIKKSGRSSCRNQFVLLWGSILVGDGSGDKNPSFWRTGGTFLTWARKQSFGIWFICSLDGWIVLWHSFFSFKKCKSETPLCWYQVKYLKYGDGIHALNQCLDPLGLCQCLLLHCNLFYSCCPAMGMSRSRYGVQSWGGHVWQKR